MISLIPIQQDGFSGDGGPASQAQFQPSDAYTSQFAIDTSGNIYIPDGGNGRVRKIDTSGPVTTIAGNGNYRFAGDGGPAAAALINAPRYVSVDPAGNIYIADTGNYRVRKVAPDGIIHTVAGNGQTYLDSAQPPTGIPALNAPLSMWIYAATGTPDGGFYFSEGFSLMHVDPTGTVTTVSGTIYPPGPLADQIPATPFSSNDVEGMAIGPDGCLYLADTGAILRFNPNGNISTVAGLFDYTGIDNGTLGAPRGFAFGAVSSQNAAPPRGNGSQSQSAPREGTLPLHNPRGPIAPIYFADDLHGYVREIDSDGRVSVIAGNGQVGYSGDGGPAIDASFFYPQAVAIDKAGFIYIADWGNGRIRRVSPNGIIDTLLSGLSYPQALAIDAQGTLYIADWGNNRVLSITNPAE
jgi:sugar lactone lactonase YvrE